jgi:UDP-2,3-diacylglucosamine pyrophosphatase LpxH
MKRYLFLSDLHIGNGSAKDDFEHDEHFEKLMLDFSDFSNVDLFIVGDGFELVESSSKLDFDLLNYEESIQSVSSDIIEEIEIKHPKVFSSLRKFAKNGNRIFYIIGNHDYYIYKNKGLSEKLLEKIPNLTIKPYHYDETLKMLVVHGNQFDPVNKFAVDKATGKILPPLGEYIVRYMIKNFDEKVHGKVPSEILRDYDNVRPTIDLFDWFEIVSKKYDLGIDLLRFWMEEFLGMMKSLEAKKWMKTNYPFWSNFSKLFLNNFGGIKLGEIIVRVIMNLRKFKRTDYLIKKAKKVLKGRINYEKHFVGYDYRNDIEEVNGVIMGHIHKNTFNIFNVSNNPKYYINCGSWKPVVEKMHGKKFQRRSELFYALLTVNGDVEIVTSTVNVLKKREVIF